MDTILTRRGRALSDRIRAFWRRNFQGAETAVYHVGLLTAALVVGANVASTYWPGALGSTLACCGCMAVAEAGGRVARWLLQKLLGRPLGVPLALAALSVAVADTVRRGAGEGWTARVVLFSALVVAALCLAALSFWSVVGRRVVTPPTVGTLLLSGGLTLLLAVFLFTDGFDDHYIRRYLALAPLDAARESLDASLTAGPHLVETLDYGPGRQLEAGTVDLTRYMSRDTDDLTGSYVDVYLEYDLGHVPLEGRVWYPADGENCPVLFIAHGNHEITTQSYLGYAYLGEYLASHGYVVVSVDQNACNMLTGENDGRAVLLLEHIGVLLEYSQEAGNPLQGRIDPESIAIAGHSRGGEMAATAYLFNGYDCYPENGAVDFDYHYKIKSIIAIAPTVNQYKPADHSVKLEDVNYLLLHGAADRDVTRFMGMAQYENVSFTGAGDYLKTALYIAGANHGQFNSLWGAYDQAGPFASLLNVESLLSQADQQQIARLFVKVFLDVTLRGDQTNRDLLTDWDSFASQLPRTVYVQCYETSRFTAIADFEEDSDLTTAAGKGVTLSADGVRLWTEELVNFAGDTAYDTHALRLNWQGPASYTLALPETDLTGQTVSFAISDQDSAAVERGAYRLVDAVVELRDGAGGTASARLSQFATVYPVLPVRTDKLDFLFDTCSYKAAFATVSIPAAAFVPDGQGIDLTRVVELRFRFENSGQVRLDNIGLEAACD